MRKLLPYVRKNSSEIYVELGSSHIEVLSVDPNETGLFGSSLSLASRILLGDRPETGFRFKASYPDNPWRILSEGEPYDYGQDLEYRTKVRRLLDDYHSRRQGNGAFLIKLWKARLTLLPEFIADFSRGYGPEQAPKPEEHDCIGYVWPSFIIWNNDQSYISFVGSPDRLELPKNVLRQTRGHPRQDRIPPLHHRSRLADRW